MNARRAHGFILMVASPTSTRENPHAGIPSLTSWLRKYAPAGLTASHPFVYRARSVVAIDHAHGRDAPKISPLPMLIKRSTHTTIRSGATGALGALLLLWPLTADAYRPFDGTDADVAELHEFELEIGPAGYHRQGSAIDFVSGGVVNIGFASGFELVLQGFAYLPEDASSPGLNKFTDTGAFVKRVWRDGCLQGKSGPSFATETGPLLPTVNDAPGFGAYVGGILSTCVGESLIIHWNAEVQILRATYDLDLFGGAILELSPSKYVVRPVAEVFVEHDFGGAQTYSGLVGVIWRVREKLSLDAAFREALIAGQKVSEVRTGFSLAIP
jgi:hypothetical protein